MSQSIAAGRRLEAGDAWVVAAAIKERIPLLTHDRDMARQEMEGLTVICHA
jgi:predicted nucleic acid-binding protein